MSILILLLHSLLAAILSSWAPALPAPAVAADPVVSEEHQLLDRLEAAAADLRSFTAELRYDRWDPVLQRKEIRTGSIIYEVRSAGEAQPAQVRRFAVFFDVLYKGNRKVDQKKHYIFDSPWLVEIDHEAKQFFKRQIVPPGQQLDPLKLGEGPFPLPIGQSRAEVLERFEVTKIAVPAEGALNGLKNVHGLRLVPKPGTDEARDFLHVDVYYDVETLLPVGIETIGSNQLDPGDKLEGRERKTVVLENAAHNPQLTSEQLQSLVIVEPDPKQWKIQITPWEVAE